MRVVLVTVELDDKDREALERAARGGTIYELKDVKERLWEIAEEVEVILCAGLGGVEPGVLKKMTSLRLVQTLMAGADHLPREVFRPGVAVCTGSGAGSHHIAEHAFALLMAAAKNVVAHTNALRGARFDRSPVNLPLKGGTLTVLGFGNIGKLVGNIGRTLGMKVAAINRTGRTREQVEFIGTLGDLNRVLAMADYVVITLPLTRKTIGLIGQSELEVMKRDAVLVNVARARIVEEEALYRHLRRYPQFRAAFDVWWRYPRGEEGHPFSMPFHELDNFIMTPHVAGHVPSHRKEMMRLAIENIGNFFMEKPLMNEVREDDLPP